MKLSGGRENINIGDGNTSTGIAETDKSLSGKLVAELQLGEFLRQEITKAIIINNPNIYKENPFLKQADFQSETSKKTAKEYKDFGHEYFMQDNATGIDELKKALIIDPDNVQTYCELGAMYFKTNSELAEQYYLLALLKNSGQNEIVIWEANCVFGDIYEGKGCFDEAIKFYLKALKCKPDDIYINTKLGELYIKNKDIDKAIEYFEVSIQEYLNLQSKDPDNKEFLSKISETHIKLAQLNIEKGDFKEAEYSYMDAYTSNPDGNKQVFESIYTMYENAQMYEKMEFYYDVNQQINIQKVKAIYLKEDKEYIDNNKTEIAELIENTSIDSKDKNIEIYKLYKKIAEKYISYDMYKEASQNISEALLRNPTNAYLLELLVEYKTKSEEGPQLQSL